MYRTRARARDAGRGVRLGTAGGSGPRTGRAPHPALAHSLDPPDRLAITRRSIVANGSRATHPGPHASREREDGKTYSGFECAALGDRYGTGGCYYG